MEAFINIEANKRNYILISPGACGRVWIETLAVSFSDSIPDLIGGAEVSYQTQNEIDILGVGDSCRIDDSEAVVVRIN